MARKMLKPDSLHVVDDLINGNINGNDGLRQWTFRYDDDGGLDAPDGELIANVAGIIERADALVGIVRRLAGASGRRTGLTTAEIRKVVLAMVKDATGAEEVT